MQAITTKFRGPTDTRGSRVIARAAAGSLTHAWDYALDYEGNHTAAARALAEKLGWAGQWVGGGLPDGSGDTFVCVDRVSQEFTITEPGV